MKSRTTLPIFLLSLLSCLSLAFCSPIPARATPNNLVQRSTDYSNHEARSLAGQGDEPLFEKRMIRAAATFAKVSQAAVRMKHAAAASKTPTAPKVKVANYAKDILNRAGHTAQQYGGVDPATAHANVAQAHFTGRPGVTKVTVTAPAHQGGLGDAHRGPDMKNHLVAQPYAGGKALPKEHVYPPAGFPSVDLKHFPQRSSTLPAPASPKPKPPSRSNSTP